MLFEVKNLTYCYPDGSHALDMIDLHIRTKERIALLGANGSGKSTLLRHLAGLLFATSGSVSFEGTELTERRLTGSFGTEFRQNVGFVFQNADAQLFNATVLEEVAFGPAHQGFSNDEANERAYETLRFLGIGHLADRPPFRLSGGEKRKVAIASVLSMNPEVLLFDEPILGLDPRSQAWFFDALEQLHAAGKTTIVATHMLDSVSNLADRAIVLNERHTVTRDGDAFNVLGDRVALLDANLLFEPLREALGR